MARFVLALIVGLLTFSASGVSSLIVDEPCNVFELTDHGEDDSACPPTCVTCGCCRQSVEPVAFVGDRAPDAPIPLLDAILSDVLNVHPRDILHVPKAVLT